MTEYYNILVTLWQEIDLFNTIKWKCIEDSQLYNRTLEKERVFDFLRGLNKDLDEVRGRIVGTKPLPSIREAFAAVRREESRRKVMLNVTPNTEEIQ